MVTEGFRYDFTPKELVYFLFKKKTCPQCHGIMKKSKRSESAQGETFNSSANAFFSPSAEVCHYYYMFTCPKCGYENTLKELANMKG